MISITRTFYFYFFLQIYFGPTAFFVFIILLIYIIDLLSRTFENLVSSKTRMPQMAKHTAFKNIPSPQNCGTSLIFLPRNKVFNTKMFVD